jgi:tRNA (guanine9-N1)-methyltransferase
LEEDTTPSEALIEETKTSSKKWKNLSISEIQFYTPTIVIDLSFEQNMNSKRLRSLASQVMYSYSAVKAYHRPCPITLTSLVSGSTIDQLLNNHDGWNSWKIFKHSEPVEKAFPIDKLIYLTPDSENLLEKVEHDKVYIIGGIVDDNQLKGLSLGKAIAQGIAHAKLPIKETLPSFRNQSLNINHIVEILLRLGDGLDMKTALEQVVPQRYVSPKPVWKPGQRTQKPEEGVSESPKDTDPDPDQTPS